MLTDYIVNGLFHEECNYFLLLDYKTVMDLVVYVFQSLN